MKKLTADVAPNAGALVLLVSLIGMAISIFASHAVGPFTVGGMTLGVVLMAWGAFAHFDTQGDSGVGLSEALERIRSARAS